MDEDPLVDINSNDTGEATDNGNEGNDQAGGEGNDNDTGNAAAGAAAGAETTDITIGKNMLAVSKEVADHVSELEGKLSEAEKAAEKPQAPEAYELVVPDALKEKITVDAEDPRWMALQAAAKERGWSQETVNDILALHYQAEAQTGEDDAASAKAESEALDKALGENTKQTRDDLGKWVSGLLGPKLFKAGADGKLEKGEDGKAVLTDLGHELKLWMTASDGVLLLKAIKDTLGETTTSRNAETKKEKDPLDAIYPSMAEAS